MNVKAKPKQGAINWIRQSVKSGIEDAGCNNKLLQTLSSDDPQYHQYTRVHSGL